jgi:hypothetical protein
MKKIFRTEIPNKSREQNFIIKGAYFGISAFCWDEPHKLKLEIIMRVK